MLKTLPFMLELIKLNSAHPLQLLDLHPILMDAMRNGSDIEVSWANLKPALRYKAVYEALDDALSSPDIVEAVGVWSLTKGIDILGADSRYVFLVRCFDPADPKCKTFRPSLSHLLLGSAAERRIVPTRMPKSYPELEPKYIADDE